MPKLELAVVRSWPLQKIEVGSQHIHHTIIIDLPHIPTDESIATHLFPSAESCVLLFWHENGQKYCRIDLARPIDILFSSSPRSIPQPLLLFAPITTDSTLTRSHMLALDIFQSDDVHYLPSSHTGDTPPRPTFLQRLQDITETPILPFGPHTFSDIAGYSFGDDIDLDDDNNDNHDDNNDTLDEEPGISVSVSNKTTTWKIVLYRENKEAVFIDFLEHFCSHLDLSDEDLPASACHIKIDMIYLNETGVGDGLVVEMLSYIWKHLFENTHHFVHANTAVKGFSIPSDHPDTALHIGHFGLLAGLSIAYSLRPYDLHPMFLRQRDKIADMRHDALLYDSNNTLFVPVNYKEFLNNRDDLQEYWNHTFDFDRRVMPLNRVTSETIFQNIVQPEMYKSIIFPTVIGRQNLDLFRFYLFRFAEQHDMNGITLAKINQYATEARHLPTSKEDLLAFFHLSPEDKMDSNMAHHLQILKTILSDYSTPRIRQLMQHVTNKCYATPVLVRFRDKTYISTCFSILQLMVGDRDNLAEQLDVIFAGVTNLPYFEED